MEWPLPDLRKSLRRALPSGAAIVQLTPAPDAPGMGPADAPGVEGRWLLSVYDREGALLVGGRPVVVGQDALALLAHLDLGELVVAGAEDPSAAASLPAQSITLYVS